AAYAAFAKLSEATAKRALQDFLPPAAVDPDRISGIEEVMADAIAFKFITAPLTKDELAELIQIPERRRSRRVCAGKSENSKRRGRQKGSSRAPRLDPAGRCLLVV